MLQRLQHIILGWVGERNILGAMESKMQSGVSGGQTWLLTASLYVGGACPFKFVDITIDPSLV